jgi:cell division protein ZapA
MMAPVKRSVTVTIAGQRLVVRTDGKARYVKELASFVTAKVEEIRASGKTVSTQSLALLAAMNIADDLFQLRDRHDGLKRRVRETSTRILAHLPAEAKG